MIDVSAAWRAGTPADDPLAHGVWAWTAGCHGGVLVRELASK